MVSDIPERVLVAIARYAISSAPGAQLAALEAAEADLDEAAAANPSARKVSHSDNYIFQIFKDVQAKVM